MRQFVIELANEIRRIENEKTLLNEQLKETYASFEDKLDTKAFKAALRIAKIKASHKGSDVELDNILEALS
jgi:uncharacterized protein (UPF0335 family)